MWLECAVDFGKNLDECAEQLAEKEEQNEELKVENDKAKELLKQWLQIAQKK